MSVIERTGQYGTYYGSPWGSSSPCNTSQMQVNAKYIYAYLSAKGWSLNAICGLLGNLEHESSINPGRWEGDNVGVGPGYGLVQWTPYSKYTGWVSGDASEMDNNLSRLIWEFANNEQYYQTSTYPISPSEFKTSNDSPYNLSCAFAWNYERSWVVLYGTEAEKEALRQKRGNAALSWYSYLSGVTPPEPDIPDTPGTIWKRKKKFNFILFNARRRMFNE